MENKNEITLLWGDSCLDFKMLLKDKIVQIDKNDKKDKIVQIVQIDQID